MKKRKRATSTLHPPAHLSVDAAKLWREVCTHLQANQRLLRIDAAVIETFCFAVERQRRLVAELAASKLVDAEGKPNPLLRTIEATAATVKNLAAVLGLSPLARRLLPSTPKKSKGVGGAWAGILSP